MGSEIIQCWKVRSSTTAGAEVETNQGRNWSCGKWYCFKIINKTLFHLHSICAWQISRSGRIIPEKEYRLNAIRKDHQRHVRECLADAIFRKVLDMEVRPCWARVSLPRCFSQQLAPAGLFPSAPMLPWNALSCWEKGESLCRTSPLTVKPGYCESRHCPAFLTASQQLSDCEMAFTGLVCLKNPDKNKPVWTYIHCLSTKFGHLPVGYQEWSWFLRLHQLYQSSVVPLAVWIYAGEMQIDSTHSSFVTGPMREWPGRGHGTCRTEARGLAHADISRCPVMGFLFLLHCQRHHQRDKKKKLDSSGRRDRRKPDEVRLEHCWWDLAALPVLSNNLEPVIHWDKSSVSDMVKYKKQASRGWSCPSYISFVQKFRSFHLCI